MTTSVITPANLRSRSGKVHARLEPGSDRFYCRSDDQFGGVAVEATDDPVTCRHCRTRRGLATRPQPNGAAMKQPIRRVWC
jgi:hypothetical protein